MHSRPISPEGVTTSLRRLYFPDGRFVLAHSPEGLLTLYPIDDGEARVVPRTSPADFPMGWQDDRHTLLVQSKTGLPARIDAVNVHTGERRPWRELSPPDPAGFP